MSAFRKAVKTESKLRLGLIGPSGSGKTYTALTFGARFAREGNGRLAVIDTERGSASKYADLWDFDVLELESFSPQRYIEGIAEAQKAGYSVLVIDSLSHAWSGKEGALEMVDAIAKRAQSANTFTAWRDVTPLHNRMVDAILSAPMHVIVTLRAKMEYVQEKDEKGRTAIRKVGLQPVQREGLEYEFDIVGELTMDNELLIAKTRCPALVGKSFPKPTEAVAEVIIDWLHGAPAAPAPAPKAKAAEPAPAPPAAPARTHADQEGDREEVEAVYLQDGTYVEYVTKQSKSGRTYKQMVNRRCAEHDSPWFSWDGARWSHGKKTSGDYHEFEGDPDSDGDAVLLSAES
jgi:hypothetical protein